MLIIKKSLMWAALLVLIAGMAGLEEVQGQTQVGSGPDASYLIIQSSLFSATLTYQYNYTYNSAALIDTYTMMTAIEMADPNISFDVINYGTVDSPNYFLNSITYNAVTVVNTGFPDYEPYWAQWVSGGEGGYPTQGPIPYGMWTFGSGISAPYRTLAPGSSDAFVYGDSDAPTVSPFAVPEPGGGALLLPGCLLFALMWKPWPKKAAVAG